MNVWFWPTLYTYMSQANRARTEVAALRIFENLDLEHTTVYDFVNPSFT